MTVAETIDIADLHPACALFPLLTGAELDDLAADIKESGLLDPIVLHKGQILDGRNRYAACAIAGVEPRFREWAGEHGSPTAFVLATNLLRRHLTPGQKAAIGAEALPQLRTERPHGGVRQVGSRSNLPTIAEVAAKAVGTNERYVREAAAIKTADPELFEKVKRGEKPLKQASREVGRSLGKRYPDKEVSPKTDERLVEHLAQIEKLIPKWNKSFIDPHRPAACKRRVATAEAVTAFLAVFVEAHAPKLEAIPTARRG